MAIENLNDGQRAAYNGIIDAYAAHHAKVIFIDGPSGTGKTYIENLILNVVRSHGDIALDVASSGIATLLLSGGRTAHSYLKIPIALDCTFFYYIRKQDDLAMLIRQTKLILWDEAPMTNKFAFETVDQTLRDLIDRNEPFGGIVFVMSGDFRQVLPVIPRDPMQTLSLHQSKTPTYGNLLRYSVFRKICKPVMLLLFTLILGIALLQTGFFVLATTN